MPRILVVDDHRDVRAMISMLLRVNHFEVIEAESVAAGLKAFEDARFDVAIVDIFLSDACGFDLITAMRERAPRLAVVAVSGMAALDSVSQSSELSDVVCLQKPFRPTDLIRAVSGAREAVSRSAGAKFRAAV
jgi:DNA-binding NtrC family response regulator